MQKNFFITGSRFCGKSTFLNSLVKSLNIDVSGFKTLPYFIENEQKGYYFHSLNPVLSFENNLPINIIHKKTKSIAVCDVFNTLGTACLSDCLTDKNKLIIMDELGRIERNETEFILLLQKLLDSNKIVLAVLKKENIKHLEEFKTRNDVLLIDLDYNTAQKTQFEQQFKEIFNEKNSITTANA